MTLVVHTGNFLVFGNNIKLRTSLSVVSILTSKQTNERPRVTLATAKKYTSLKKQWVMTTVNQT
jgi:hypothetical protein